MIKHIALLSFICFILSCQSEQKQQQKQKINYAEYAELIKGDWVGPTKHRQYASNLTEYLLIDDSTIRRFINMHGLKYKLRDDTLIVEDLDEDKTVRLRHFTIAKLTKDSLIVMAGRYQQDSIQYAKAQPKNSITPTAIYFAYKDEPVHFSSEYFIEIDSSRNIRFWAKRHPSRKGGYKGKLSEKEYNSIVGKIRTLQVDSLKLYYTAPWATDQTMGVSIVSNDKIFRSSAYAHYEEPMELYFLLGELLNTDERVDLQPDPSVNESYFDSKLSLLPVMSPPPPVLRKSEEP